MPNRSDRIAGVKAYGAGEISTNRRQAKSREEIRDLMVGDYD